jgi:hypothetical protein
MIAADECSEPRSFDREASSSFSVSLGSPPTSGSKRTNIRQAGITLVDATLWEAA